MIEKISKLFLSKISTESDSEDRKSIILFAITKIVEDSSKIGLIFIICALLGFVKEFFMIAVLIAIYKTNIGGVHCKTNLGCFINTLLFFLISIYASQYIIFEAILKIGIYLSLYIFGLYVIWVYVPADVPEIPIISIKTRKRTKIVSLVMLNVLYLIAIVFIKIPEYQNIIIYTIFYINIMTTRTIYRLFKTQYGYENYIPEDLMIID